ncbi:winged helix-turn-helix domain-containing protein [Mycoplasmopsis gallinacea]|uniref:winged helix-turn-helix domain-containing protein n=1 Tax=Mycoplasmopsis gallinacea TaxID=29556 RepID=UPI001E3C01E0|nr:winged helix-turn-helix domain-containing protein [Mycoplasmopsis gallinacea]
MTINSEFLKDFTISTTKETDQTTKEIDGTTKETTKETAQTTKEIDGTTKETYETNEEIINIKEQILLLIKNNPNITAKQIANEFKEITEDGVWYHLRKLKSNDLIKREGSTKSDKWVVTKSNK